MDPIIGFFIMELYSDMQLALKIFVLITIVTTVSHNGGHSSETARVNREEGGDDVKSSWPLRPGLHTYYNGGYRGSLSREAKPIPESPSQSGSQSATRLCEVGIASNPGSACRGEYVPGPCTHRPSHHESRLYQKLLGQPHLGRQVPKVRPVIGVKS